ncbi:MAG: hypothetical protein U0T84_06575 [Chitinophagales bacterium]
MSRSRHIGFVGMLLFCTMLLVIPYCTWAQPRVDFIDGDQIRIDKLDGSEDGRVQTYDSLRNQIAQRVYFQLIDSIQNYIDQSGFIEVDRRIYRDYLFRTMRRVYSGNYRQVARWEVLFTHFYATLKGMRQHQVWPVLRRDYASSLELTGLFRYESIADSFLLEAMTIMPGEVLQQFAQYAERPYAAKTVEAVVAYAPTVAKAYYLPAYPAYDMMKASGDTSLVIFRKIIDAYGKKSNAMVLMDDLVSGKLTIRQADSITKNNRAFFQQLWQTRIRKNMRAAYSVEKELEIAALKLVREVNDLHNENNEAIRFAAVNSLSAEALYVLIVYSEEDIFTSSFNGIYKRLTVKLGKEDGFDFLRRMNDLRFRTFVKQCAAYGKLDAFLTTMSAERRNILMVKFAANLGVAEGKLSEAVEVADAYTSISDSAARDIVQRTVATEYEQCQLRQNKSGIAIYGLLQALFGSQQMFQGNWYQQIQQQYHLAPINVLPSGQLFANNGRCIWYMNFYDDDDGEWSYRSFVSTFKDKNWVVDESHPLYTVIRASNGKLVDIYANKPKQEYEGQAYLEHFFDSLHLIPDVLVHRGHSYYASKTIDKTTPGTRIFVLGSCGGYHKLSSIIDRSPEVRIISSKQIGVFQVNNPIVKALADNIREGTDVDWQQIWKTVDARLKGTESYGRFLDYIPPHKNLGAIFISAYSKQLQ